MNNEISLEIQEILNKYPDVRYSITQDKRVNLDCEGDGELEEHLKKQIDRITKKDN